MVVVPVVTGEITPPEFMVATPGVPELQTPPEVASVSVPTFERHTVLAPEIATGPFTVAVAVTKHPPTV